VLFYDTENLFHTVDDAGVNDEEFLPKGWTIKPPVFKSTKIGGSYKYQGRWQTIDFCLTNIPTLESNYDISSHIASKRHQMGEDLSLIDVGKDNFTSMVFLIICRYIFLNVEFQLNDLIS